MEVVAAAGGGRRLSRRSLGAGGRRCARSHEAFDGGTLPPSPAGRLRAEKLTAAAASRPKADAFSTNVFTAAEAEKR